MKAVNKEVKKKKLYEKKIKSNTLNSFYGHLFLFESE